MSLGQVLDGLRVNLEPSQPVQRRRVAGRDLVCAASVARGTVVGAKELKLLGPVCEVLGRPAEQSLVESLHCGRRIAGLKRKAGRNPCPGGERRATLDSVLEMMARGSGGGVIAHEQLRFRKPQPRPKRLEFWRLLPPLQRRP